MEGANTHYTHFESEVELLKGIPQELTGICYTLPHSVLKRNSLILLRIGNAPIESCDENTTPKPTSTQVPPKLHIQETTTESTDSCGCVPVNPYNYRSLRPKQQLRT